MNLSWYGHSCFQCQFSLNGENVSVVIDPYSANIGLKLPNLTADFALVTHQHEDHNNIEALRFTNGTMVIDSPGEYEIKNVFVQGMASFHDESKGEERGQNVIYKIKAEEITIAHLGDLGCDLTSEQLEALENVDILLIPVGGKYTLDAKKAAHLIKQIDPKIVIPMHYKTAGSNMDIDDLQPFAKEMGLGEYTTENSLKVSAGQLVNENVIVKILKPLA
ncbi:MAG TPA: MBL fold metallo-hydrolase [bacterium]|nr:MBL fold metallo-hydrolase [bacterium]